MHVQDAFELVGFAKATALSADEMLVYDRNGKGFIPGANTYCNVGHTLRALAWHTMQSVVQNCADFCT